MLALKIRGSAALGFSGSERHLTFTGFPSGLLQITCFGVDASAVLTCSMVPNGITLWPRFFSDLFQ